MHVHTLGDNTNIVKITGKCMQTADCCRPDICIYATVYTGTSVLTFNLE